MPAKPKPSVARRSKKSASKATTKKPPAAKADSGTAKPDRAEDSIADVATAPAAGSAIAAFCRTLPATTVDIKWKKDLMFSVGGKIYAGMDANDPDAIGFKCDDIEFERLTRIDGIIPAPYAARFGWVSVTRKGVLSASELKTLVRRSYELVVEKLPAKVRRQLQSPGG